MIADADRIAVLRARCLDRKGHAWRDVSIPRAAALRESASILSWQARQGRCTRHILARARFAIDDLEILAGRLAPRPAALEEGELAAARSFLAQFPGAGGQTGHCELDLTRILSAGIEGVEEDIRTRLATAGGPALEDVWSFQDALQGLPAFIGQAASAAREQIAGSAPDRRQELTRLAEVCDWISRRPPRTFRDAIQLLWLVILAVQYAEPVGLVAPGRLDRSLWPFYEADRAAGRLSREEALLLIESLYLLVNEFIPDGLAIPVMVGGRDAAGADTTNELSYVCLEALRRTKLAYPTVGVCWHAGTPPDLTGLAVDLMAKGYSTPAFFGDEVIQRGLRALKVPSEEACHYINSTCVEITPVGGSNVWVASPYHNLCAMLLEEIDAVAADPPESFAAFKKRFYERLDGAVAEAAGYQNRLRRERAEWGGKPLQSVFTRDCLKRGRDIDHGGAVYNWVECSFVGLANLADSLHVIREEIFNRKRMTFRTLKDLLDSAFKDQEVVRLRFLNGYPKYGQGDDEVDALVTEAAKRIPAVCSRHRMFPDDSPCVPGSFVWIMHEQLGRITGATPDGRKAGTPFADGAGPAQGRESKGPTAAILSATSWDHSPFIGGVAFNMKFNAALFNGAPQRQDRLRDLLTTYLRRGGFEVQVNVVDRETLLRALEKPEAYRDLVVRIGGYTDYFTRLSPEMQQEVMLRTAYERV